MFVYELSGCGFESRCSHLINDISENFEDYNPAKKIKVLIMFDNMIADVEGSVPKIDPHFGTFLAGVKESSIIFFLSIEMMKFPYLRVI